MYMYMFICVYCVCMYVCMNLVSSQCYSLPSQRLLTVGKGERQGLQTFLFTSGYS